MPAEHVLTCAVQRTHSVDALLWPNFSVPRPDASCGTYNAPEITKEKGEI